MSRPRPLTLAIVFVAAATFGLAACSGRGLPELVEAGRELPAVEARFERLTALALDACGIAIEERRAACEEEVRTVGDALRPSLRTLVDAWCSIAPSTEGCAER